MNCWNDSTSWRARAVASLSKPGCDAPGPGWSRRSGFRAPAGSCAAPGWQPAGRRRAATSCWRAASSLLMRSGRRPGPAPSCQLGLRSWMRSGSVASSRALERSRRLVKRSGAAGTSSRLLDLLALGGAQAFLQQRQPARQRGQQVVIHRADRHGFQQALERHGALALHRRRCRSAPAR